MMVAAAQMGGIFNLPRFVGVASWMWHPTNRNVCRPATYHGYWSAGSLRKYDSPAFARIACPFLGEPWQFFGGEFCGADNNLIFFQPLF
jgi:hypothetical protein